jgi:hypothetical protein
VSRTTTILPILSLAIGLAAGAAACDPRAFSDQADTTWVVSSTQPGNMESDDFVVALAFAATDSTDGTRVMVAGNSPASVGVLNFTSTGSKSSNGVRATDIQPLMSNVNLAASRPFAGSATVIPTNPAGVGTIAIGFPEEEATTGNDTGLIMIADATNLAILRPIQPLPGVIEQGTALAFIDAGLESAVPDLVTIGRNAIIVYPDVIGGVSPFPDPKLCTVGREAAYAVAGADVDTTVAGNELLIMRGDVNLAAGAAASDIVVTSGVDVTAADDAGDTGRCFDDTVVTPRAEIGTLVSPNNEFDFGLEIITGDFDGSGAVDIAASAPSSGRVYVWLDPDFGTAAPGAPDVTLEPASGAIGFATAIAAGDLDGDGDDELAVGAPGTEVDGTTGAGSAFVYELSGTSFSLLATLHDVDPEGDQQFGRDVLMTPFDGGPGHALAVATKGELFTYFRVAANYPDLRD